jgi:hypothetical protein
MAMERLGSGIITALDSQPKAQELERVRSAGIALLIVGFNPRLNGDNARDPLIWTIVEREGKTDTGKRAGDISVPAETRKIGEDRSSNVLGALAEFCDDGSFPYVRRHLLLAPGVFNERGIKVGSIEVDMSVLVYDGSLDYSFTPLNSSEVSPNGWLNRSQIERMQGVRSVLGQAIAIDRAEGLSAQALEAYYINRSLLKPAFPINFRSMGDFYRRREMFEDVPLK